MGIPVAAPESISKPGGTLEATTSQFQEPRCRNTEKCAMPTNVENMRTALRLGFEDVERWRRKQASERPNAATIPTHAAEILSRLAASVDAVDDCLIAAYTELVEGAVDVKVYTDMLAAVGFGWNPLSATEFVSNYISSRTGTSRH
jgi:hypothetical protein